MTMNEICEALNAAGIQDWRVTSHGDVEIEDEDCVLQITAERGIANVLVDHDCGVEEFDAEDLPKLIKLVKVWVG
ncbi:MAG: hypothetical protein ACPGVG_08760 [Mycobacterium sp.]